MLYIFGKTGLRICLHFFDITLDFLLVADGMANKSAQRIYASATIKKAYPLKSIPIVLIFFLFYLLKKFDINLQCFFCVINILLALILVIVLWSILIELV